MSFRGLKQVFAQDKTIQRVIVLAVALLCVSAVSAEERLRESKFSLKEYLASGRQQFDVYEHKEPYFSLRIPEGAYRKWHFVVFDNQAVPFYIATEFTASENLPFVSSSIFLLPEELKSRGNGTIFEQVTLQHEAWEKNTLGENIKLIKKGNVPEIEGYAAFERIFESPEINTTYHIIYIIFDNTLLQLGINAKSSDFALEDQDFMNIIKTFKTR
jgi:hypothetical protein